MTVYGIDGAPNGWSVAFLDKDLCVKITRVLDLSEFSRRFPNALHVAIDMIIGLPDKAKKGGRMAEKEARKLLRPRGSVVFSAPCRDAVYASSYSEAVEINRNSYTDHVGLSKQAYNICPKIREVDRYLQEHPHARSTMFETHPEISFWQMNNCTPLQSKHKKEGREQRISLLRENNLLPNSKLSIDDLDALACLWSALRIQKNKSKSIPSIPPTDRFHLPMKITW